MGKSNNEFVSNESAQASVRVMAVILFCIGLAIAYWVWPAGITNIPLVQITFGALLWAAASAAITLATLIMAALLWIN